MSRPIDHRQEVSGHRSGDWTCPCGQSYRVLAMAGEVRMWPRNSSTGCRLEPVGDYCACGAYIARGTVLCALFGATVPVA
jgi:hypothetical protein